MDRKDKTDIVCHVYNTSEHKRENGETWIKYWKRITGKQVPKKCPCCGKTLIQIQNDNPKDEVEMVGAHVQIYNDYANRDSKLYITPTCNICNDTYKKWVSIKDKKLFAVAKDSLIEAKVKD